MDREEMEAALDAVPRQPVSHARECICGDTIAAVGWKAHKNRHLRQGTYEPSPKPKPREERRPYNRRRPTVDEACQALLASEGAERVPISAIGEVTAWVELTRRLVERLKEVS